MARMIPPVLPPSCRSPGEKMLFSRFKEDPETRNWVVLHSLGVATHPKRLEGEIDFVVIVPDEGVLCLEVKAGSVVREDGVWRYGSGPSAKISPVGPFKQASDAMHALKEHVKRSDPSLKGIMFISGVLFTYIDFDEVSMEWHPWQYADRSILSRSPISACCLGILRKAHQHVQNTQSARWYDHIRSRPTEEQVNRLVRLLRGDFECFVSPRAAIEETEQEIFRFTEEQFLSLDMLEENDRIVFKGPAGTGKTFLAIEAARRSLFAGKRTLLVCYNRLLGRWLARQTRTFASANPDLLDAGTLHRILLQLSGLRLTDVNDASFWSKTIPDAVVERALLGSIEAPRYDALIIDEAQDLITEEYLDILDLLLEGGLAGGRWVMFGDFERQSIYTRQELDGGLKLPEAVRRRSPVHFSYPIRTNCRNTETIAVGLEMVCRLKPGYSRVLQTGRAEDIDVNFYRTPKEQVALFKTRLKGLSQSLLPSEVVVLSTREDASSCAEMLFRQGGLPKLEPLRNRKTDHSSVGFTTIQAFKGMEAPGVILTDIEELVGEKAEALLYIGMSRARQRLVMLMHEDCRHTYLRAVRDGFTYKTKGRKKADGES